MNTTRLNKYDTLKGILIITVLLGHIIGAIGGNMFSKMAVFSIYAVHMPLFMIIAGKFAKFKPIDAMMYIALSLMFDAWFVMAVGLFYLLIPILARIKQQKYQLIAVGATILIGLLAGYLPIGRQYPALSRYITFLPYFLIGYYNILEWRSIKYKKILGAGLAFFCAVILPIINRDALPALFMSDQYGDYTIWHRMIAYAVGILTSWWLLSSMTNKNVPILTKLGASTLWVYLLHEPMIPFVVMLIPKLNALIGIRLFSVQLAFTFAWCMALWPVAILFQKSTTWLQKQWKPLNVWFQHKLMPKE